ncbi:calcium-binding EGF-like domain-containing protein, partial [Salmonella sp. s51228]|uniref:calcium-binding EGF-like domain-containing protein n=1 Tax=Salmonella sp. s51228 TaxID=3159652 RepID=UPI0039818BDD
MEFDECSTSLCSHTCSNSEGSYTCICPTGYKLDTNRRSCIDINECIATTPPCDKI